MDSTRRFELGHIRATPGALNAIQQSGEDALSFFVRHVGGDWGVVCAADKDANDRALIDGERLVSAYLLNSGEKIWLITEADRSASTVLLPDEY